MTTYAYHTWETDVANTDAKVAEYLRIVEAYFEAAKAGYGKACNIWSPPFVASTLAFQKKLSFFDAVIVGVAPQGDFSTNSGTWLHFAGAVMLKGSSDPFAVFDPVTVFGMGNLQSNCGESLGSGVRRESKRDWRFRVGSNFFTGQAYRAIVSEKRGPMYVWFSPEDSKNSNLVQQSGHLWP